MIPCSSAAACRFFILVFCFLFYGPGRGVEDVNNVSGFQSRGEWFRCECFAYAWKMASCAIFYKLKIGLG
jgi:hypothetical protein